jgi:UDP-N-acetyl-D-glucosamine dehydrogenase
MVFLRRFPASLDAGARLWSDHALNEAEPHANCVRAVSDLLLKIQSQSAHVVVVGIGYVGLPLVAEIARAGFRVTGYDADPRKVQLLALGESYIPDVPSGDLAPHVASGRLRATTNEAVLSEADAVVVCVPTPLNKTRDPDMRYILQATESIARHQHRDMLVVLESTTYPGTTSSWFRG